MANTADAILAFNYSEYYIKRMCSSTFLYLWTAHLIFILCQQVGIKELSNYHIYVYN